MTRAAAILDAIRIESVAPQRFGRVTRSANGMLRAGGIDLAVGSGARIATATGWEPAIAAGFGDDGSYLLPLAGDIPVAIGARVAADARVNDVAAGEPLLGRVIDALGAPLDRGMPLGPMRARAAADDINPLDRAPINRMMPTGVRAIDALLTLGVGQRVAIIAGSGVG